MFVDHPVGTGWSYGSQVPTNLNEIADEFLGFLLNFYTEYP
jgi:carboxypeptidase C (cathepsin A)